MFAPPVAKAQTKASESSTSKLASQGSTLIGRPFGNGPVERADMLQRSVGNQTARRIFSQRARSVTANGPLGHDAHDADPASLAVRNAPRGLSWDFSKISIFSPDRAIQPQAPSPLNLNPLPGVMKPKLAVGRVEDPLEHEADRVAEHVMRMPAPAAPDRVPGAIPTVQIRTPSQLGGGKPLAEPEKTFFESRLRYDFSNVRVHTDARAAESARAINAAAYTIGQNIVFDTPRYVPHAPGGRRILAHELAHVVQQSTGTHAEVIRRQPAPIPPGSTSTPAAAPQFTQSDYDAAVALIATRNARLYGYLQQGRVGSTVRVRTEHLPVMGGGPGSPTAIDFFFDLQITAGGAVAGARASFGDVTAVPNSSAPTATLLQPLPFVVNAPPPGATNTANQLAEELFHEGLHMLIKMDRVMQRYAPGAAGLQTGTLASFNTYKARAQAGSNFLTLQVDLSTVIGAYFTANPGTPGAPTTPSEFDRIANVVIDRIIEERFAVDQQRQQFTGSMVAGTTNDAIARGYLRRYLADEGVILAGNSNLTRLFGEVTAMLNDIPTNLGAPSPPPAGSSTPWVGGRPKLLPPLPD
jgi:uncharacterized protein DUF4157